MVVLPESTGSEALPAGLEVLWRERAVGRRGPRRALSVDRIAAAAIVVADAEGLGAVSMARVAEAVGVSTMALYRYVASKEDLVVLMYDAALGAPGQEPDQAAGWRERLRTWATDQLTKVGEHPWVMDVAGIPRLGPNRLAWIERGLAALSGTPLPPGLRTAVMGTVALHVLSEGRVIAAASAARRDALAVAAARDAGPSDAGPSGAGPSGTGPSGAGAVAPEDGPDVAHPALLDYGTLLRRLTTPDDHPAITEALAAGGFDDEHDAADSTPGGEWDVVFGLELLLDGIAALIARTAPDLEDA